MHYYQTITLNTSGHKTNAPEWRTIMTTKGSFNKRDRAYVEESQIETYRQLAGIGSSKRKSTSDVNTAAYRSLKDVFLMAASIGVKIGRRTPLRERKELIMTSYLNNYPDMAVLNAIAIAHNKGVDVLTNLDEILTIAEEYANTGFEELSRRVLAAGMPLLNLAAYIMEEFEDESSKSS
jgi:dnd system-associated protein 4